MSRPHPGPARPSDGPTTAQLSHYRTAAACLAALLVLLILVVRLITVPLALATLLTERASRQLDKWLARVPLPPQPVQATADRLPLPAS